MCVIIWFTISDWLFTFLGGAGNASLLAACYIQHSYFYIFCKVQFYVKGVPCSMNHFMPTFDPVVCSLSYLSIRVRTVCSADATGVDALLSRYTVGPIARDQKH